MSTLPGMKIEGYMTEVDFDGQTLRVHGKNKPARIALAGEDHDQDVVLTREQIQRVELKDASRMVNGNLRVHTTGGKTYQLHFRRKQAEGFRALAEALGA
jgi:hypothetical protein